MKIFGHLILGPAQLTLSQIWSIQFGHFFSLKKCNFNAFGRHFENRVHNSYLFFCSKIVFLYCKVYGLTQLIAYKTKCKAAQECEMHSFYRLRSQTS